MNMSMKSYRMLLSLLFLSLTVTGAATSKAATKKKPLVVVVHGIGDGNRADGWSDYLRGHWKTNDIEEITFRYKHRGKARSMTDMKQKSGKWAKLVQRRLKQIARENPGRDVIIVAHSWGSVMTKLALNGGVTGSGAVDPLNTKGFKFLKLVTIGSPAGNKKMLRGLDVVANDGKPKQVHQWENLFDPVDPVSKKSHKIKGAKNTKVEHPDGDTNRYSNHTEIWYNPYLSKMIDHLVNGKKQRRKYTKKGIARVKKRLEKMAPKKLIRLLKHIEKEYDFHLLSCMCSKKYRTKWNGSIYYNSTGIQWHSPSCADLSNGSCVLQATGCYRAPFATSSELLEKCMVTDNIVHVLERL